MDQPGEFPYRRGIYPEMYRQRTWTMRQYSGFGGPKETNQRFKEVIKGGGTGLSMAFDLPTQLGLDSDHELSLGEVGRTGVAIDTVDDLRLAFDEINLGEISTSMTINSSASVLLVYYLLVAQEQGVDWKDVRGTIQNDILKEYIARGTYIYPPEESLRIITDLFSWCDTNVPRFNVISVSGYHIREAGATAVQELAFTLANGREYMRRLIASGQDANRVGQQISFFFSVDNGLLEEVAKFRAARILWAELLKEEFNCNEDACRLRFHCQTAGSALTAQQPQNNAVRVALQALSSVFGGTQSLHTNSIDEALGLPTADSARLALRTQQIISEESGLTNHVDPFGGSYVVEEMTDKCMAEVKELWKRIDEKGGVLAGIDSGLIQSWIQGSAYKIQKEIESGERKIVGVNSFKEENEAAPDIFEIDAALEKETVKRLTAYKKDRDQTKVQEALKKITQMAETKENIIPFIMEAGKAKATVGEICQAMKEVFNTYQPTSGLTYE
ncbi:MAG: methylmalonyl-CoA mutase [Planctomycetota bacterium]|nr:MAG: methylmalonyl-CoA mutase [Planctomycetota bacterium]